MEQAPRSKLNAGTLQPTWSLRLVPGVTDASGTYNIQIKDKHEEEICAVVLASSPRSDCNEIKPDRESARIVLARDTGMSSDIRFAKSLGFLKQDPPLLQMYALADDLDS